MKMTLRGHGQAVKRSAAFITARPVSLRCGRSRFYRLSSSNGYIRVTYWTISDRRPNHRLRTAPVSAASLNDRLQSLSVVCWRQRKNINTYHLNEKVCIRRLLNSVELSTASATQMLYTCYRRKDTARIEEMIWNCKHVA